MSSTMEMVTYLLLFEHDAVLAIKLEVPTSSTLPGKLFRIVQVSSPCDEDRLNRVSKTIDRSCHTIP